MRPGKTPESAGSLSPGFPAQRAACDHRWRPHTRGSSACGYRHRPARRANRLPPRRRPGRARTAGVRRRPVRLRPAAPVSPPDPDSGGWRPVGQSDAFGDWFTTTSDPPRRGRPGARRPRRDRFGWLLSPWLLAPTAAVAVATTGVALWLWQTAPTVTVQARPGAVTSTVPAAAGGRPPAGSATACHPAAARHDTGAAYCQPVPGGRYRRRAWRYTCPRRHYPGGTRARYAGRLG